MKQILPIFLAAVVSAGISATPPFGARAADAGGKTGGISGVVSDAAGNPLAGATVEYWTFGPNYLAPSEAKLVQQITTAADGGYEFPVDRTFGNLVARKQGLAPAWLQLGQPFFRANGSGIELKLTPPGVLAGLVVDESNRPVAGAEVSVADASIEITIGNGGYRINSLSGKLARNLFAVKTDATGHFRIENFPTNATAHFAVQAPGRVLGSAEGDPAIGGIGYSIADRDIRLVIEPAGGVEGKVICAETNQRLPAAQLTLQPAQMRPFMAPLETTNAHPDGSFRFDHLAAGSYRLDTRFGTNSACEWVADTVPVTIEEGQIAGGLTVTAVRGGLLEVTVRGSEDHQPLSQVMVSAFRQNFQSSATSDGAGLACLRLLPGDYQVSGLRDGGSSAQGSATVEAGTTNRVELEIAAPKKIRGVVHLPDGQPAAGLAVRLVGAFGANDEDATTDAEGKFEMDWSPRQFNGQSRAVCVLVRDADRNLTAAEDVDEDTGSLDLKLAPGLTLAGRAECDGKPITNATATLVFWIGNSGMWLEGWARTNPPGHYEIPALSPGRKYGVVVSAPGYGQKQLSDLEIQAEPGRQELDPVDLKPANLKLAGQVLDAEDKPVAGCNVSLNGEDQPRGHTRTDRQGRFHFDQVCAGPIRLFANGGGGFGNISAEGGDTNVVLRLGQNARYAAGNQAHKLAGQVTDANGQPDPDAQLSVFPQFGDRQWTKAGADGHYHLIWSLQPWQLQNSGGAQLVARDPGRGLAAVEDLPEDATNLDIKMKAAVTLAGQVRNSSNAPLPGAEISLLFKTGNMFDSFDARTKPTDGAGRYEINDLPADGQYIVFASARGYGRSQQNVEPEAETNRMELPPLELKLADQVIAGQVLQEDDKPASGVNVNISGDGQPSGNMTTDGKGRFHFRVCEGRIQLFAFSQYGAGNAQATVDAGDTNIVLNLASQPGVLRQAPPRASLKGNLLPDLTTVNLAAGDTPAGKPVLLCLFDVSQRPSRHLVHLLDQRAGALGQKNVCVVGVQAVVTTDEIFNDWKAAGAVSFPMGRVTEKSGRCGWAANTGALPWLVLADAGHKVVAEGFSLDELDAQIQKLSR